MATSHETKLPFGPKQRQLTDISFQSHERPTSKEEIPEAIGTVTSDSLAAESLTNNGEFGQNNPKAGATSQPSRPITTKNRDTSSATTFDPAPDAEAREAGEGNNDSAELSAGRSLDDSGNAEYNTSTGGSRNAGIAPTGGYSGSAERARGENEFKPHGKNITEGGFDSNAPYASFNQDIGTEKDPGRLAEQNLEAPNA